MVSRPSIGSGAPLPLGVTPCHDGINVAVVSRHAERIYICVFDVTGETEIHRFVLPGRLGDVHCGFVAGIEAGARYGLRAEGPWDPAHGHRFDPAKLLVDPYAKQIDRGFIHRGELALPPAARIDTAPWVPKGIVSASLPRFERLPSRRPGFIYEIAIRAFSKQHPGIPEALRGTARALACPESIEHLSQFGVDTVELMPVAAWIDERHLPALGLHNAWGYNPVVFMVPDPRLAPGGIEDLRAAVAALHQAGIRVLLDIVLNHTGESDVLGPTLSLRGLDNALYYRHADKGTLVNDTGCGNTLALDRAPVLGLAMDSLRYWVESTGIDGFRFDLATVLGRTDHGFSADAPFLAAISQDPVLSSLTLIAEPWDAGPGGYQLGHFPASWHEWNDRYRDDVRRFWRGDRGSLGALATRLAGSSDIFAGGHRPPSAGINYIAAHDGFTLRDAVTFSDKRNEANGEANRDGNPNEICWVAEDPERAVRNLLATLFLSRGIPMLTAGDEFGRSQQGNNNAYAQDNETTRLDWGSADRSLIAIVAELAHLRRAHPALTDDRFLTGRPDASGVVDAMWIKPDGSPMSHDDWTDPNRRILGLALQAEDDRLLLWFNSGADDVEVDLPPRGRSRWVREFSTGGQAAAIAGHSMALFAERRKPKHEAGDDMVKRLASEAGIDLEWWEVDGTHHAVGVDALRTLLAAMRLPAGNDAEAKDSLARITAERTSALPRSLVMRVDEGPVLAGSSSRRRMLRIRSGTGEDSQIACPPGESLRLPRLPAGFHDCWLDDAPDRRCRLIVTPGKCFLPESLSGDRRPFGFAAHLYALRRNGDQGIGDFETLARFGESSARAGGAVAGINPLHHLFPSDRQRVSPYQPSDRRFLDPIYIDVGRVLSEWQLPRSMRLAQESAAAFADLSRLRYADYGRVWEAKAAILASAFAEFQPTSEFEKFENAGGRDLEEHGIFETLAARIGTAVQSRWPAGNALADFVSEHRADVRFRSWMQWIADRQLADAARRSQAAGLSIGFYRDLALGTAFEGGEVWSNPQCFAEGVSLGAPPDPFARQGQVWNLPPNVPLALAEQGFDPIIAIISANMRHAGALRIDHILGYARQFWIPEGAPGSQGSYVRFPADALIAITAIESHRHRCAVIGEDLGTVPEGLRQTLAAASILSYRVLWFEREGEEFRPPGSYPRLSTSCLGSHDLPTFLGWRRSVSEAERNGLDRALEREGITPGQDDDEALAAVHEFVSRSRSALMLVQVDDLDREIEPLNVPGTDRDRPNWRRRNRSNIENLAQDFSVIESVKRGRNR